MAEVYQVSEFGPMSGSTGKRKKYKKLVLGAAVRAKLASAMLAPLLALGAAGLITLAAVENSTMNALPDSPAQYGWQDGGGQSQGNPPANAPDNPKPPEPPKEPEKPKPPEKKPTDPPPTSSPPTDPPPTSSPPTDPPPTDPPAAPVYYNDDSGDDDSGGPSTTEPSATGDGGSCVILGDEAVITGKFHLDLGSATSAKVSAVVYLDGSVLTDGVWDPDNLTAYGASGDYPITYSVTSSGAVQEGTSLSMVLTVTFEPDGTTQTITIPITIPRPPFTAPTLSFSGGEISRDGREMTYSFNYSVDTKSASQVTVVATLTLDDSAHTTVTRQFTHYEPNNVSGATISATYQYPADNPDNPGDPYWPPTQPPSFNATLTLYVSYEEYGEDRVVYPTPDTITYTYSG